MLSDIAILMFSHLSSYLCYIHIFFISLRIISKYVEYIIIFIKPHYKINYNFENKNTSWLYNNFNFSDSKI